MAFGGYLKQNTAVDVLLGPFVEDGDADTPCTGLTLDVEVSKNGQALANKNDATAPVHDPAGTVDGYYNCELDGTDTNTLGILTVIAHHADALPVRFDFQIVTANWFDSMCSTENLDVNVKEVSDDSTAADDLELFVENAKGTDHKALISTDAQDLSGTLDVNTKTIAAEAVDSIHDEEVDNDGTAISLRGVLKLLLSVLTGKSSGGGTSTIIFRDIADSKNRISVTVDSNGNRTAVGTRDAT